MAVEIELEPEGTPSRHTQVTQTELSIHEVEVIVKALAAVGLEESFMRLFVMPGLVGRTSFHRREDVNEAGMIPALTQNFLDAILLAKGIHTADEFNIEAVLLRHFFSVGADLIPQRFREARVIENADTAGMKESRHPFGITDTRQSPLNDDTVIYFTS